MKLEERLHYCVVFDLKTYEPLKVYSFKLGPNYYRAATSYNSFGSKLRKDGNQWYAIHTKRDFDIWYAFQVKYEKPLPMEELENIWDLYLKIGYQYKTQKFGST